MLFEKKIFLSWTMGLLVLYALGMIIQQSYVKHLTRIVQRYQQEALLLDQQYGMLFQEIAQLEKKESICAALAPEEFVQVAHHHIVQLA